MKSVFMSSSASLKSSLQAEYVNNKQGENMLKTYIRIARYKVISFSLSNRGTRGTMYDA